MGGYGWQTVGRGPTSQYHIPQRPLTTIDHNPQQTSLRLLCNPERSGPGHCLVTPGGCLVAQNAEIWGQPPHPSLYPPTHPPGGWGILPTKQ